MGIPSSVCLLSTAHSDDNNNNIAGSLSVNQQQFLIALACSSLFFLFSLIFCPWLCVFRTKQAKQQEKKKQGTLLGIFFKNKYLGRINILRLKKKTTLGKTEFLKIKKLRK